MVKIWCCNLAISTENRDSGAIRMYNRIEFCMESFLIKGSGL